MAKADDTAAGATSAAVDSTLELPGDAATPRHRLGEGATVGHFRLGPVLGEGGMGVVHEAYDPDLDRKVAIKLVGDRAADTAAGRRLIREAQAMARLAHPGVVAVHEVGTVDDQVFVVMERLPGGTLDRYLAAAPRPWRTIVERFLEAGEGLAAAHRAGLIHRDFKPSNVLLDARGHAKVSDFGIARLASEAAAASRASAPRLRHTDRSALGETVAPAGAMIGTPAYMAPEQARGEPVDPRADQYAFAVALHEALLGHRPGATPGSGAAGAGAADRARIPGRLRRTLARALAAAPADRFPSMAELVARLRGHLRSRRQLAAAITATAALAVAAAGVARWTTPTRIATCDDGGALLDEVWSPPRRRAIDAAFAATGRAHAADTIRTTTRAVETWAESWRLGRRAACHAEPAIRAARIGCLDRQLGLLAAQLTQWQTADGEAADRAVAAAAALPPAAACAVAVTAPPPPAALAPLVARIADLTARQRAGHVAEAQRLLAPLLADAERAADPTVLAEARAAAAELEGRAGEATHARALALLAARSAAAIGDDRAMAVALLGAVAASADAGHATEGLATLDAVEALVLRAHLDDLDQTVALRRGEALTHAGDPAAAVAPLTQAVALAEARAAREPARAGDLALALALLADAKIASHDYADARALLTRTLAIEEPLYGAAHPEVARTLHDLAVTEYRLDDVAASRGHLDRALAILTETYGPTHALIGRLHISRGTLALTHDDPQGAIAEYNTALDVLRAVLPADHPDLASAEMGVAGSLRDANRCADAIPHAERGVAILVGVHKVGPDLAQAELTLGMCLAELKRNREATVTLHHVLEEFERAGMGGRDIAEPLAGLAELADADGHHAEALALIDRAIAAVGDHPAEPYATLLAYLTDERARWRRGR